MRISSMIALLISCSALAQSDGKQNAAPNTPIPVCISTPLNQSVLSVSPSIERDRLVHEINEGAQKKKAKIKVNAIGVEGSRLGDAESDARDKECTYLVIWEFRDMAVYGGGIGGPPGSLGSPGVVPPVNRRGNTNNQNAGVNYRIVRVGSSSQLDDGTLGLPAGEDENSAALYLERQLSSRVVHAVLQERPPKVQ